MKSIMTKWQKFIEGTDGWTTVFCENHDNGRAVSRFGSDDPKYREISAKMLAIMMVTMTGTLFLYQGQEIGMINAPKDWPIEEYKDVEGSNYYKEADKISKSGKDPLRRDTIMKGLQILARDHSRLPMQWDDSPYAGFTTASTAEPWMRTHDLYKEINVARQRQDPNSVLSFYKMALNLRKEHGDLFIHGAFHLFDLENEQTFIYGKSSGEGDTERRALVALNFTDTEQPFTLDGKYGCEKLLVSNYGGDQGLEQTLRPYEGRVYLSY